MARATKEQLAERKLDKLIEQEYYRVNNEHFHATGNGLQIDVLNIDPLFKQVKADLAAGKTLPEAMQDAVKRFCEA